MNHDITGAYMLIADVDYLDGELKVSFENGDEATVDVTKLKPAGVVGLIWPAAHIAEDRLHIEVPANPFPFRVAWDTVRRLTDRAFAKAVRDSANRQARLLGARVRQLREQKGLSQHQTAELAGVEPANLSRIENGQFNLSSATLWRILAALGCSISELATERPRPHTHKTEGHPEMTAGRD